MQAVLDADDPRSLEAASLASWLHLRARLESHPVAPSPSQPGDAAAQRPPTTTIILPRDSGR